MLDSFHKLAGLALAGVGVFLALIVAGNVCGPLGYPACFREKVLGESPSLPPKVVVVPTPNVPTGNTGKSDGEDSGSCCQSGKISASPTRHATPVVQKVTPKLRRAQGPTYPEGEYWGTDDSHF